MRELDMYKPLMRAEIFPYDVFAREVPIGDYMESRKRIDIVLLDSTKTLTAIEVKIRDWRSAIKQAFSNLFATDFSYVALWHNHVQNVDRDLLAKTGIGLISIHHNRCHILQEADKSKITIGSKRYYLMAHCNELKYYNESRAVRTLKSCKRKQLDRGLQKPIIYHRRSSTYT